VVGKLLGGGLVLLGTALLCRAETRTRRQQTDRLAELSAALSEMAAGIRSLRRTLPCLLRQQTRRPLCGAYFGAVLEGLESGQSLPDAWADAFRQLEPPEAGRVLRDTELTGDEERIVSALPTGPAGGYPAAGPAAAGAAFVDRRPVRGGTVYHLTDVEDDTWTWI